MVHTMPWYAAKPRSSAWGWHWTMGKFDPDRKLPSGLPEIASHVHPLIGLYDSNDRDVIECQLLQMKLAGISGVIVDWYGTTAFADYAAIHAATQRLFEATKRIGLRFAVCYEDRTVGLMVKRGALAHGQVAAHLRSTMAWASTHWFASPHYLRIDNRPVVLNFGPITVLEPAPWRKAFENLAPRPCFLTLPHLWRKVEADGHFAWLPLHVRGHRPTPAQVRDWLRDYHALAAKRPTMTLSSAFPGFHDIYEEAGQRKSYGFIDDRNGDTLRDTLRTAMEGPTRVVQLITWNDYGEGTVIEPTHEHGYRHLEIILAARRREAGDAFPFRPADLRLPAELLGRRRQHASDAAGTAQLDAVADALIRGDVNEARKRLARLAGVDHCALQRQ
jgi:hypothetical protein